MALNGFVHAEVPLGNYLLTHSLTHSLTHYRTFSIASQLLVFSSMSGSGMIPPHAYMLACVANNGLNGEGRRGPWWLTDGGGIVHYRTYYFFVTSASAACFVHCRWSKTSASSAISERIRSCSWKWSAESKTNSVSASSRRKPNFDDDLLPPPRRLCFYSVCLPVCLSVCHSRIIQKVADEFW